MSDQIQTGSGEGSTMANQNVDAAIILPLFREHPALEQRLPHVSLGQFPTPIQRLDQVGEELGLDQLYIKRDDLSGMVYGGNKVRKLEFLLGDALRSGAREVITMGFAGSNHALATAIYARQLGLKCTTMLLPQVNAHYVQRNLLAGMSAQAELRPYGNFISLSWGILHKMIKGRLSDGVFPQYIPPGGSCPLGVIGYVNAALELREQIEAGMMPEPDRIYVPLGSMGTAVGLSLGLQAAGIRTQVVAVRVIEKRLASHRGMVSLFHKTGALLRKLDPTFPSVTFTERALVIRDEFFGEGYARFTEQGVRAARLMQDKAGIILNGAYSAKAFSAVMGGAAQGELKGKVVLFWNTYNSRDLGPFTDGMDYRELPREFHQYFEAEVQALERAIRPSP